MRRLIKKISALIIALTFVLALSGCLADDFALETTTPSNSAETSASAPRSYVRMNFDAAQYPYFAQLNEAEKNIYSQIYEELSDGNKEFECKVNVNSDQLARAIDSLLNDHPELFWIDSNYGFTYDSENGMIKTLSFTFFDFADTPEKLIAARTDFNNIVDAVIVQAMSYQTAVERELFVHDYICQNTVYDVTAPYNQSAYSALVLHKSVCAGYARSFQYLMQRLGLTCYYVAGKTTGLDSSAASGSSFNGSHSWNMLLLDGEFYNVDTLWDDTASETYGSMIYPFFNLTDEALVYHARIDISRGLPVCTGTKYKYSNQFGPTVETDGIIFVDAA